MLTLLSDRHWRPFLSSLAVLWAAGSAGACSTNSFDAAYQAYPDCARGCLACPDDDYTSNLAHHCTYSTGECCTSAYHGAIAASWGCVKANCDALAQPAFDTFVQFCAAEGVPLSAADVPAGYTARETSGPGPAATPPAASPKLTTAQIIGIVFGAVSAIAGVVGAFFGWRRHRRTKRAAAQPADAEDGAVGRLRNNSDRNAGALQLHAPLGLRPWEAAPVLAAQNGVFYKRQTSSFSLTRGYNKTTESFELPRRDGRDKSSKIYNRGARLPPSGFIVDEEEVD